MKTESSASIPDPAPKTPAAPPGKQRRWLHRTLWTLLGLVVVLAVFHRPILRFTIDKGGKYAAKTQGMEVDWRVRGTVTSDLELEGVSIKGDADAPVRHLTAERLRTDHNIWKLLHGEPGSFVEELVLINADLDLDTSKFPKSDPNKPKSDAPPPAITVPRIRLENVNARISLPEGDLIVRGLDFTLESGKPGILRIKELVLPWVPEKLANIEGRTEATASSLALADLRLSPDATLTRLAFDLGKFHERAAAMEIKALLGGSTAVSASGTVTGIGKTPVLDAALEIGAVTPDTLTPYVAIPGTTKWQADGIKATIKGPPAAPRELQARVSFAGSNIVQGDLKLDRVQADLVLENGVLNVSSLDVLAGSNALRATATVPMPEEWRDVANAPVTAKADINFPKIEEIFTGIPPVTGKLTGTVTASTQGAQLLDVTANLQGSQWTAEGIPIDSLEVTAGTDGRIVRLEKARVSLDPENSVEAAGTLSLEGDQPVTATFQIDLPNIERFASWAGLQNTPGPESGWVRGSGSASGTLTDWQKQDFSRTTGEVRLEALNAGWKTGRLESLSLNAAIANGRATLNNLVAVLNERNRLTATGAGSLAPPYDFTAKVDGDLTQLTDFNGWLQALQTNKLLSGKASLKWEGSGTLETFSVTGGGTLGVDSLRMEGMKEPASLALTTSHSGRRADISVLDASLGQFKLSAPLTVTDEFLEIPKLRITVGNLPPVEGVIKIPLDFEHPENASSPVADTGGLNLALSIKSLDLTEAARAAGQPSPVRGRVDADVKVTGTIRDPAAEIALKLQNITVPDVKQKLSPASADVTVSLKGGRLTGNATVTQSPLQPLRATASLPFDLQAVMRDPDTLMNVPLDATVTLPDSQLAGLRPFIPGVASLNGRMGLTTKITGTPSKPHITGLLNVNAPAIAFSQADVPDARNVVLRVRFDGKRVFIEEAGAMLAGGTASARGTVDWTDAANPRIDATLRAQEALILRDETISMRADGLINVRGSLTQAAVTGRVELVRGRVFKEIEFLPLSLPNQLPPAPPAVTVSRSNQPTLPPPLDKWTFNIDIVTRDAIRLLGNVLNGGVVTNLRLTGTGAGPVLEGKASLQGARVRLPFSRMAISRGDVIFTRDKPFQPELDVQGDAFINNYQVTLFAYGPALSPKLRFTSSPPLSEGEIATLLATGSTSGDLRSSQGEAANRAAFLLLSQAYRKLFRKNAKPKLDDDPPRLSFSFSLLNNSGGTRSVSAVYEINSRLQAIGSISQAGSFRGLLYYLIRFR